MIVLDCNKCGNEDHNKFHLQYKLLYDTIDVECKVCSHKWSVEPLEKEKKVNDTERLNWLEKRQGFGLISDDFGRWAVSTSGIQNLPDANEIGKPFDVDSAFFVAKEDWKESTRDAIDHAMKEEQDENSERD